MEKFIESNIWLIIGMVNIPVYLLIARIFFGSYSELLNAFVVFLKNLVTFELFFLLFTDFYDSFLLVFRLILVFALIGATVYGEYELVRWLFPALKI